MTDPQGFLARWSQRKRAQQGRKPEAPPSAAAAAASHAGEDPLADLPPLETLGKDSDFRPFMRPGVPEELRKAALRKLWGSDPVYANLDGLLEYGDDFAAPFRLAGAVATAYRVLAGMPAPETEPAAAQRPAPPAPAAMEDASPSSPIERASAEGIE